MTESDREALENIESELNADERLEHFGKRSVVDDTGAGSALIAMLFSMLVMAYVPIDLIKGLFFLLLIVSTSFLCNSFIQIGKQKYFCVTDRRLVAFGKEGFFSLCDREELEELDLSAKAVYVEFKGKKIKLKKLS